MRWIKQLVSANRCFYRQLSVIIRHCLLCRYTAADVGNASQLKQSHQRMAAVLRILSVHAIQFPCVGSNSSMSANRSLSRLLSLIGLARCCVGLNVELLWIDFCHSSSIFVIQVLSSWRRYVSWLKWRHQCMAAIIQQAAVNLPCVYLEYCFADIQQLTMATAVSSNGGTSALPLTTGSCQSSVCNLVLFRRYKATDVGNVSQLKQRHQRMATILQQAEKERLLDVQMALVTGEWDFEAVKDAFGISKANGHPIFPYKRIDHWRTLSGQEIPDGQESLAGIFNHQDFDCDTFLQVRTILGSRYWWPCSSKVTMQQKWSFN